MKKRKLDNARSIVEDILGEIEKRSYAVGSDPAAINHFQTELRQLEDKVSLECLRGIPHKYLALIREKVGAEIIEALDPGKLGAVFKNRDRIHLVYKKIAVLVEKDNHALNTALESLREIDRLKYVQKEMVESQTAHLQEMELIEQRLLQSQWLIDTQLQSFEEAMSRIIAFLEAKHIEVYLFDDDHFLTNKLNTDGKAFIYNKQQEATHDLPHAIEAPTFQEVQESIYETPLIVEGRQIGHYRILCAITPDFDRDRWIKKVALITPIAARIIEANQNRLHAAKVYTDDLTQLYNKRKLNEQMGRMFKQFKTGQKKLFVSMIDIDKFKILNDTYGHPVGDEVLKRAALIIRDGVPYAYRYGGEEFCAVFYGYEKQDVIDALENLRKCIETTSFAIDGIEHSITISSGIAEFEIGMNAVMDAIDRADKALYVSKEDGRNRCTYYDDIKDRYLTDASRLRQRNIMLEEEITLLRQQLSAAKDQRTAG
ncbi:MAG: diguanylate cyclase [Deltaproteobacteria bacterium]|nr:diguanylate cyclase [Deltaproteobacteria bacterium]